MKESLHLKKCDQLIEPDEHFKIIDSISEIWFF